jgi:AcrR family transcriptional regulator
MKETRPYVMTARAEAAHRTGERILDAATALFWEQPTDRPSLEAVAERAGVSVQTVIRRFGGSDGLFAAAGEREAARIVEQRREAPAGDVATAVRVLVTHYEEVGLGVLRLQHAAASIPRLMEVVEQGRDFHREWCEHVFAPWLAQRSGRDRRRLLAQCMAVCDVRTWELLRHQAGLGRTETERALVELLAPLQEVPR